MSAILIKSYVGQAETYFVKEFTNERENYYAEGGVNLGRWTGRGAEQLGLAGEVGKKEFSQLSRGINPTTGERFRRMTFGRTREIDGEIKQVKEISGWDMVISAPKSISIVALIGGDENVRTAHIEAVADALERAERQAQSNNGGGKSEQTNNLIIARFQHDSARPDSKNGFVAPQLHDHCYIMNATFREDGKLKPLESLELHKAQGYIRSVYYSGLTERLKKLGYQIEIDRETGAPEIKGISKQYRESCSPRRKEILELAEKAGKNFRQLGLVNRREKIYDKSLIREQHRDIDKAYDNQAVRLVEETKTKKKFDDLEKPNMAKEAITFALAKLSERESVFVPRDVLFEANRRSLGNTSVAAIEAEFENRIKNGKVKTLPLRDGRNVAFLSSDEKIEADLPKHIQNLQSENPLEKEIGQYESSPYGHEEFLNLSDEQKKAVTKILQSAEKVLSLEGRAGVGKTTTLSVVSKVAKQAKYQVVGLAPTTGATQELNEAGIESRTLQKLLASKTEDHRQSRFYIVDESSFISSRQMDKFLREAVNNGDRVLFVGDTRQHEAIEAGKPFARMQNDKLTASAKLETIRRQAKETDRKTVQNLSEGKTVETIKEMRERGQIKEIEDRTNRHNSIVEAFTDSPETSLVIAPRNKDREEINSKIHNSLRNAGKIGEEEKEINILRPRNELTGVEREFAGAYQENDIVIYRRGSKVNKIPAESRAKVIAIDSEQNHLTVEIKKGEEIKQITYDPKRLRGVTVWREDSIKVSEGERLQLRSPFENKQGKFANGTMVKASDLTKSKLELTTDKGKTLNLDTKEPQMIDYGYAVTSHSSQGKTVDNVLIHAETSESRQLLNQRMAYVAVSRAKENILIFTDDASKLAEKMARRSDKSEIPRREPKNRIAGEIIEKMKESLSRQSKTINPEVWTHFNRDLVENFSQQKPSENQLKMLNRLKTNDSRKSPADPEMTRLEAVQQILNLADERERESITENTINHYEKQFGEKNKEKETNYERNHIYNR